MCGLDTSYVPAAVIRQRLSNCSGEAQNPATCPGPGKNKSKTEPHPTSQPAVRTTDMVGTWNQVCATPIIPAAATQHPSSLPTTHAMCPGRSTPAHTCPFPGLACRCLGCAMCLGALTTRVQPTV
ncbi:hypothetical protein BC567DRAFT_229542 [Phyllosticta citribraziliensis]